MSSDCSVSDEDMAKIREIGDALKSQVQAVNSDDCVIKLFVRDGATILAQSIEAELSNGMVTGTRILPMDVEKLERLKGVLEQTVAEISAKIAELSASQQKPFNPEQN